MLVAAPAMAVAPVASNVAITGTAEVGQTLTGGYTYSDADGDLEGTSTFRWLRNGAPIAGANGTGYLLQNADQGQLIVFEVTPVALTGIGDLVGAPATSAAVGPIAPANTAPVASNVTITGTLQLGQVLTGSYTYSDADGDVEGTSTFRWLRNGAPIGGATASTYTIVGADLGQQLVFEVTPVAVSGVLVGTAVQSAPVSANNVAPVITGQNPLTTAEDTPLTIQLTDIAVTDPDNTYPDDFTLTVFGGTNYTVNATTITPAANFSGELTVPLQVNDGIANSNMFNATVTVTADNDGPVIVGQNALVTTEDTPITLLVTDFIVEDPDNTFPNDFTLSVQDGTNYTRNGNTITPAQDFEGQLNVPVTVNDGTFDSPVFVANVTVGGENDPPVLVTPIPDQLAVENSPFSLDLRPNFSDVDNPTLDFNASGLPPSGNLALNNGVISGTPELADTRDLPYTITVTASDGEFTAVDDFLLTISELDRANVAMSIAAAPDPAMLDDEIRYTFSVSNSGPTPAPDVEVDGSFVGSVDNIVPGGSISCNIQAPQNQVTDFVCGIGSIAVGATTVFTISVDSDDVGAITAVAIAGVTTPVPLDPNPLDNFAQRSIAVAESFSNGAADILGARQVLAIASGDVTGEGSVDIVTGTAQGQPIQIFAGDGFRNFSSSPTQIQDNAAQTGIVLADFDGNNSLDIAVSSSSGGITVYRNDGAGNFALLANLPTAGPANDLAVADFDNNQTNDLVAAVTGGNAVYFGDGVGNFVLHDTLGDSDSRGVAVGRIDGNNRTDIVFANVRDDSRVWLKRGGDGFNSGRTFNIGDALSVVVAELIGGNNNNGLDIAFARTPSDGNVTAANPVYSNNGNGNLSRSAQLGLAPTNDILAGDIDRDGQLDLVFINDTGVHQIWNRSGGNFELHGEQILASNAVTGFIAELGMVDTGDDGGIDLAIGGQSGAGAGVFLNDGVGNLGKGDPVPPVMTLNGTDPLQVPSGQPFADPGVTATDNIDGDISSSVVATGNVDTSLVGTYMVTYNVMDAAGNAADPLTRTVSVTPATGTGGGGGQIAILELLFAMLLLVRRAAMAVRRNTT